jgi:chromosome segregation ATPase
MDDDIRKVLGALDRVQDHLAQLPDLIKELNALGEQLAPVLKGQAEEIAKLDRLIEQKHESDAFKLSAQLTALTAQVARAQERHDQLAASEQSLKGRLDEIREKVEKATEGFRVARAS